MPVVNYTTVNGRILHEDRNGVKTLFMPDTLGNVIETRNMDTGAQTSSTTYWPYGEVRTQTGTNPSPFGFCGVWGYYTQAGQPTYVRARYYRPHLGRWQTVDPLWPWEDAYTYARQSPAKRKDYYGASPSYDNEPIHDPDEINCNGPIQDNCWNSCHSEYKDDLYDCGRAYVKCSNKWGWNPVGQAYCQAKLSICMTKALADLYICILCCYDYGLHTGDEEWKEKCFGATPPGTKPGGPIQKPNPIGIVVGSE
jgi:RHS repeat-associated protein